MGGVMGGEVIQFPLCRKHNPELIQRFPHWAQHLLTDPTFSMMSPDIDRKKKKKKTLPQEELAF